MIRSSIAVLTLTSVLVPALGDPQPAPAPVTADTEIPFVAHEEPEFAQTIPTQGANVLELLAGLEAETDTTFVIDAGIRSFLAESGIELTAPLVVPPSERWAVAEAFLAEVGGRLSWVKSGSPRLLTVHMANSGQRGPGSGSANHRFVPEEQLEHFADLQASLIVTSVAVEGVDVRNLANSIRSMTPDQRLLTVLPAGNTDALILQGTGAQVVTMARLVAEFEQAAVKPAAVSKSTDE